MKSPFKFLDSYTKEDRKIFFGRDREIEELYHRVFESRLMLVYGVSGTGKSSLLHCGLANKFQETDWLPLMVRRGGNIIESMASVIKAASITPQGGQFVTAVHFKKAVKSLYLDHYKPVFLIFDQFEELFIFGDKEERKSFIQIIKSLIESDLQCRLIFVMREEYMAGVTEFEKYIPTFFSNRVRIEKMARINAIEAIKGPCKVANIDLEEGFAEALLEKLSPESTDVELTYLQVFLDRVLRLATTHPHPPGGAVGVAIPRQESQRITFTISLLSHAGNVSDLLGRFLEEQIKVLEEPETGLTILKSFVSIKGTKKQQTLDEVNESSRSLGKDYSAGAITEYLQKFVNLRILREKDENGRYELRHDSLASKIYEKITLVEKELMEVRNFVENEYENYKKRNILLNDKDLIYISRYEKSLFLNPGLSEFIRKSKEASVTKVRVFRIITTIASVVFILILCGLGYYSFRSSSAVRSKNLALESLMTKNDYPVNAWEIARQAYDLKKTPITKKALFESFFSLLDKNNYYDSLGNQLFPRKEIFDFTQCESDIISARFSSDGEIIYGIMADSSIKIWDKKGHELKSFNKTGSPLLSVKISGDNKFIGTLDKDSTINIWQIDGTIVIRLKGFYNRINPDNVLNFSPDGKFFAFVNPEKDVTIYKTSGEKMQTLNGHKAPVTGIAFSPDNRLIATSSIDSTIMVWYFNKKISAYDEYTKLTGHRNIVWSVCFSMNSKFIISASADSTCKIWDLNGRIVFDHKYSLFDPLDTRTKFSDAIFSANDSAIIFTKYKISKPKDSALLFRSIEEPEIVFEQDCRIMNENFTSYPGSSNLFWNYRIRFKSSDSTTKTIFHQIDINKSTDYLAYTFNDDLYTVYFSETRDVFKLFTFTGMLQQFSPDGNYLLTANKKSLHLYPATEKEILRLTDDRKIYGKLKPSPYYFNKWFNLK